MAAPSPSAASDLDLQAVEGIPRETLVALLKRKDKEAKGFAAKLEKLEERYVKVVRNNRIFSEDRISFQRFCAELLVESEGAFEEAAAQETPVNLDALLRQLGSWRSVLDGAKEDSKIFKQFLELVFPGDEQIAKLFEGGGNIGLDALDILQQRWAALEDRHNESIASVNAMSREQMMARVGELDAAVAARRDAERRAEDLQAQLMQMHREKAQMLTKRMSTGADEYPLDTNGATSSAPGPSPRTGQAPAPAPAAAGSQLRGLREALNAAERREREAREAAARREQELRGLVDSHQAEAQRAKRDLERSSEDAERHKAQARALLEEKETTAERLRTKVSELEQELGSNSFIAHLAEQQAKRDVEMRAKQRQIDLANQTLADHQQQLELGISQERVLKDRIRELEGSQGRGHVSGDYLKHVVMKYMEYTQVGDLKAQGLVPVLCTLLSLSPEERRTVEQPGIPQPLLLINQAVGSTSSWLRGGLTGGGDSTPAARTPSARTPGARGHSSQDLLSSDGR